MNILNRSDLKSKSGFSYFEIPELARIKWLQHAFLTRQGGVSDPPYHSLNLNHHNGGQEKHVLKNRRFVATAFGFDLSQLILLNQVHQDKILLLREPVGSLLSVLEYDATITNARGRFLGILTADCIPILVVDLKRKVIAAIHAGRQGTALHIVIKVLKRMRQEFGCLPGDLLVSLGPAVGPCCYEIDEKVFIPEWEPFSAPKGERKWMVDLARINIAQMKKEGIQKEHIFRIDLCTSCHNDLLFSYRKEGQTGRQLSFIGII
jgi:polyphenol oxidase